MNESCAREVTLLEAFETTRPPSPSWSDDDRAWADRVAREAAGSDAAPDAFLAQRARHALQRLGPREPFAAGETALPGSGRWVLVVALIAFGIGLVADSIGSSHRVNLLAPPLWGVIAWNVLVYLALIGAGLAGVLRRRPAAPGPLVRGLQRLARLRRRVPRVTAGSAEALQRFAALWAARSAPLALLRAESVLHAGAAALGLGLVAGLYARGLVFDYRAAWESTFLSPASAHALVATVLAPAAQLSGIAVPDAAAFAALRATPGDAAAGVPAAPWIHLFGLTLLLVVVLPRCLLALGCAARAGLRAQRFVLPLDTPYYQRLLRLQRGGAAKIGVWPYAQTPTPQATLGLQAVFAAAFGPHVAVQVAPTVAFGMEDDAVLAPDPGVTHGVALFDLNATPEAENQGRFVERLAAALPPGAVLAVLVDEAAFAQRFGGLADRLAQRQAAWRGWGERLGRTPVFVDLAAPSAAAAIEPLLQAAFVARVAVAR